ncbi:MAG: hypothetical protein IT176_10525, partial [Acidobacteria bacterium]|nr:hypothetical protein [Acidobacteriota bacterium]
MPMFRRFLAWALVASMVAAPLASVGPSRRAPRLPFIPNALTSLPRYQLSGAASALGGRQLMLISQVAVSVGPAAPPGKNVMSASNENSTTPRTVQKENLAGIPDRYSTDIAKGDQEALDLQMFDIVQMGEFTNMRDWSVTMNVDGSVTYTSKWGSTVTGTLKGQRIEITKKAGTITDTVGTSVEQPPLPPAALYAQSPAVSGGQNAPGPAGQSQNRPGANTPGAVLLPSDAQLAINKAMETYFSGLTHNIKGTKDKNGNEVPPVVQQGVALMYTTMLDSLIKARLAGNAFLAMTPLQKDQFIAKLRKDAAALLPLYNNFIALQNQVDNVPGSTEGIRQQYAKFKAQAAQLELQGKHAEAVALLDNLNGSLYDRYVKAREKFYAALAGSPLLAVPMGDSQYFQVIGQPDNAMAAIEQFDQAAQGFVNQLSAQIDRIAQMDDIAQMLELGGPLYAGAQATAAASGGDFTRNLVLALQGTWDGTEGVYQYEKGKYDTTIAVLSAIPVVGLPFAAVQIYQEGSEYVMAVGTEQDMKDLMAINGGSAVAQAQDVRDSAGNKFATSVALLPAQVPGFLQALRAGKVAVKSLKNLKASAQAAAAAREVKAAAAAAEAGNTVKMAGAAGDAGAGAGVATAAGDAAAEQRLAAFLQRQAQTSGIQEVQSEMRLAKQAGMSDAEIARLVDGYDPNGLPKGNLMIAEELQRARLEKLGYNMSMTREDYLRLQKMSVQSYARDGVPALSKEDVAWLQGKLAQDPAYIDKLTKNGYYTGWSQNPFAPKGTIMPNEGFIGALNDADDVARMKQAFVNGGGRLPPAGSGATAGGAGAGGLGPGDATVRLNNPQQPFGGANDGTVRLNNPAQPFGGPDDATVKLSNPQQPFGGASDGTVRLNNPAQPFGGPDDATVKLSNPQQPFGG